MNRYGRMALDHSRQHRPKAFSTIEDPASHFARLGAEIEEAIGTLRDRLVGSQAPGESPEEFRLRSYQARRQAEEVVLATLAFAEPEPTTTAEDDQTLAYRRDLERASRVMAGLDRDWTEAPAGREATAP